VTFFVGFPLFNTILLKLPIIVEEITLSFGFLDFHLAFARRLDANH